jgi:hypothetical protein
VSAGISDEEVVDTVGGDKEGASLGKTDDVILIVSE